MRIWIITDYRAGHEDCLKVAEKLGGGARIIAEEDLRGYMLRRFVQRERGNYDLPDIVISTSIEAEHSAINIRHEIGNVFNVKLGAPRSKPHYRAFDLIVSYDPPASLRLSPEDEARVLYMPAPDAGEIAAAIDALRAGRPMPTRHIFSTGKAAKPHGNVLVGLSALFGRIGHSH